MRDKFDVIIIGAGPAGLKCAEQFKNSNISVLLIEKNKVIGPKVCAGGLTSLSAVFDFPDLKARAFEKLIFYFASKKHEIDLVYPIRTIDRYDLGQYLLDKIKDCKNIRILKKTTVIQIKENRITTSRGDFYYKCLVGADGSSSLARKYLGLKSELSVGLCYKAPKITDNFVVYASPKLLGSGYIWIFPHKNYTHIGVYFHPEVFSAKEAKEILDDFLKKNNYSYFDNKLEAAPINFFYQGCVFKNIFLIGDAAGLASEITGEGISYALISGKEIGRKIINPDYKMPALKEILKIKKRQRIAAGFVRKSFLFQKIFLYFSLKLIRIKWFQKHFGF
ncbi:MAG: FAD-binding protein [Candidatus Nealsonbacteria bacterium]|nr:FAD-binding protein [Candidatus Nealsonbacteria bacterium]